MIKYALLCQDCETGFDAWFRSSDDYDQQVKNAQITCPACNSAAVTKQIMAPAVASKDDGDLTFKKFAKAARAFIGETHDYVGGDFADEAVAMHYGEIESRPIWGETTHEDREKLKSEGVEAAPLPAPFVPPKPKPPENLN
ncbi:MAG: DUF1178 family protein [Pseudomonadota bacterium]